MGCTQYISEDPKEAVPRGRLWVVEVPPECRGRSSNCASLVLAGMAATPLIVIIIFVFLQ
jgi:hypothetical protein